jgi:hypothetical protein
MLYAKSEQEAQTQLFIIEQCTSNDRVKIKSKKTENIRINDNKAKNKPLVTLFRVRRSPVESGGLILVYMYIK